MFRRESKAVKAPEPVPDEVEVVSVSGENPFDKLAHMHSEMFEQLNQGAYTYKRTNRFIKKMLDVQIDAANEMVKIARHEETKFSRAELDFHSESVFIYKQLVQMCIDHNVAIISECKTLQSTVVDAMYKDYAQIEKKIKSAEAKKSVIDSKFQKLEKEYKVQQDKAVASWKKLKECKTEHKKNLGKPKEAAKALEVYTKQYHATIKEFDKTEELREYTNKSREAILGHEFSEVVTWLRLVHSHELYRISQTHIYMTKFIDTYGSLAGVLPGLLAELKLQEGILAEQDGGTKREANVALRRKPQSPFVKLPTGLPISARSLRRNDEFFLQCLDHEVLAKLIMEHDIAVEKTGDVTKEYHEYLRLEEEKALAAKPIDEQHMMDQPPTPKAGILMFVSKNICRSINGCCLGRTSKPSLSISITHRNI
jgi:hypothetical protein